MSNLLTFKELIGKYLSDYGKSVEMLSNLHDTSFNKEESTYLYNGSCDLCVIDMDQIAQEGYRFARHAEGTNNIVKSVDAFLINFEDEWFFIEFKDRPITAKKGNIKDNVLLKAYSNWYMILDILYQMKENNDEYSGFTYEQPIRFAREHIHFILVCSKDKNPSIVGKIKDCALAGRKYTPPFMQKIKDYMFKDAYVYTEDDLRNKLVQKFQC